MKSSISPVDWLSGILPTDKVGAALEALVSNPTLSLWQAEVIQARNDQLVVRRNAAYRHPDVQQICRTLDDGTPANPADLAALTADRLDEIARGVRNDNANRRRPFWNEDQHRQPDTPKHEESCRDALLGELRRSLPDPSRNKKNGHPKLWSALRDRLIAGYTRDPATDGHGIYRVLWFGDATGHRTPPPPCGVRPDGPEALRARLEEALPPEGARKISVCMIDVSAPAAKPQ